MFYFIKPILIIKLKSYLFSDPEAPNLTLVLVDSSGTRNQTLVRVIYQAGIS